MTIIDGKEIAARLLIELKQQVAASGIEPGFGVVQVGTDPASTLYVKMKLAAAKDVGILGFTLAFPDTATESEVLNAVRTWNAWPELHGIIVQVPLPAALAESTDKIIAAIDPEKDADGYHPATLQSLRDGKRDLIPVMSRVILKILDEHNISDKTIVVVARNPAFIEGQKILLEERGAHVISAPPDHPELAHITRSADVLIAAGRTEKLITADMVKDGAVVIDIGIVKNALGKTVGCVDFDAVAPKCSAITPVPGGVGPLTVAYLLWNTFELAQRAQRK